MTIKYIVMRAAIAVGIVAAAVLAVLLTCNAIVVHNAKGRIYSDTKSIPEKDVALLLGTSPTSRITSRTNYFYEYRIQAAAELYHAKKVNKILISGDEHSHRGVDETLCMQRDLVKKGVPAEDILRDGKGYRTEATIKNAYNRFGFKSFTVVSQHFHNERSLFLADRLGLPLTDVQAYDAESPKHALSYITYAREYLARVKMFLDLYL